MNEFHHGEDWDQQRSAYRNSISCKKSFTYRQQWVNNVFALA